MRELLKEILSMNLCSFFSKNQPKIIWVASYPRSGNTWLRIILNEILFNADSFSYDATESEKKRDVRIPGYGKNTDSVVRMAEPFMFKGKKSILVKTHTEFIPKQFIKHTIGSIYIYRHPLDVFLSLINFSYALRKNEFFKDKKLMTVDEIIDRGLIYSYLEEFTINGGFSFYKNIAGTWIDNINFWKYKLNPVLTYTHYIRYEDLLINFKKEIGNIGHFLNQNIDVDSLQYKVDMLSKNNAFFWKKRLCNYKYYLTDDQINYFYDNFPMDLNSLGYDRKSYEKIK